MLSRMSQREQRQNRARIEEGISEKYETSLYLSISVVTFQWVRRHVIRLMEIINCILPRASSHLQIKPPPLLTPHPQQWHTVRPPASLHASPTFRPPQTQLTTFPRQTQHLPSLLHHPRTLPPEIPLGHPIRAPNPRLLPPPLLMHALPSAIHLSRRLRYGRGAFLQRMHRIEPTSAAEGNQTA